jgi:hypothetical protein
MKIAPTARLLATAAAAALCSLSAQAAFNPDLSTWTCVGSCGTSAADGDIDLSPLGNAAYGYVTTDSLALNVSPLNIVESGGGGSTFSETNGSAITSGIFSANAGDVLSTWYNYVSTDGKSFDDYAWARLVNASDNSTAAWLFTARSNNRSSGNIVPGDVVTNEEFDADVVIANIDSFQFNERTYINWTPLGPDNGTCWDTNATGCGFTGWLNSQVTVAAAGNYRVEIGVTNFGDDIYHSGLAYDFAGLTPTSPVPEPGSLPMLLSSLAVLGMVARRRTRR